MGLGIRSGSSGFLPFKDTAVLKRVGSFKSPPFWLSHVFMYRRVLESFKLCSLHQCFDFLSSIGCRPVTVSIADI